MLRVTRNLYVNDGGTVSNEITLGDGNITKFRIPALSFSISASAVTNGAAFYENAKTVAADYTLSGSNAMASRSYNYKFKRHRHCKFG